MEYSMNELTEIRKRAAKINRINEHAPEMYEALDHLVTAWNNESLIAPGVKEMVIKKATAILSKIEGGK